MCNILKGGGCDGDIRGGVRGRGIRRYRSKSINPAVAFHCALLQCLSRAPTASMNPSDSLAGVWAKARMRDHSASLLWGRSLDRVVRKDSSSVGVSAGMNVSAIERNVSSCAGLKAWGGILGACPTGSVYRRSKESRD